MKLWHTERKPPTTIAAINEKCILYQIRKINVCNNTKHNMFRLWLQATKLNWVRLSSQINEIVIII